MGARTRDDLIVQYGLNEGEAEELERLLADMRRHRFTDSGHLSAHIVQHRLGYRYPNISGIVRMRESGTEWDFRGGFPPHIYRIVCLELGLGDRHSNAVAVGFKSFADSENQGSAKD
jgi:hypothetical protein